MPKPKADPWNRGQRAETGFRADPRNRELVGVVFERLTVVSRAASRGHRTYWQVKCACGSVKEVSQSSLVQGRAQSCGCLQSEVRITSNTKHGLHQTPTYICWVNMRVRCNKENSTSYHNYGGRGIQVCARWEDFKNFVADMGEKPENMTIERKDVNGNYEPGNCVWATNEVQHNNKRSTVYVTLEGDRMSMSQAARRLHITPGRVRWALQKHGDGWLSYVRAAAEIGKSGSAASGGGV